MLTDQIGLTKKHATPVADATASPGQSGLRAALRRFFASGATGTDAMDPRRRLLHRIVRVSLAGGIVAYLPSAYLAVRHMLWPVLGADSAALLLVAAVALFSGRLSFRAKVTVLVVGFYLLGAVLLVYTGPFGAGNFYLFAAIFMTALFGDIRSIGIINSAAAVTQVGFAVACGMRLLPWEQDLASMFIITVNFVFIAAILSYSANYLIRGYAGSAESEKHLSRSLEASLRELEHRVRNNLQVVTSLISLRSNGSRNPELALVNIRSDIEAIAKTHRLLYDRTGCYLVELDRVLRSLLRRFESEFRHISFTYEWDGPEAEVDGDVAVAVTVMLNEIITNATKHAFAGRAPGRVTVHAEYDAAVQVARFTVSDDGRGMSESAGEVGLAIVDAVASQLHARVAITPSPGVEFRFELPVRRRAVSVSR